MDITVWVLLVLGAVFYFLFFYFVVFRLAKIRDSFAVYEEVLEELCG